MKWKIFLLAILLPKFGLAQVEINQATYWFDSDISNSVTLSITPDSQVNFANNIPTASLSSGAHTFHISFKQSDGKQSVPASSLFVKIPSGNGTGTNNKQITACQYWFDNNYNVVVSQPLGPADQIQTTISTAVSNLGKGAHILNMRFKDDGNCWSSTISQLFINRGGSNDSTTNNSITACRYWVDTAFSKRQTLYISNPTQQTYIFQQFNFSNQDTGQHIVYYQFKDTTQTWSSVVVDSFIKLGKPRIDYITPNKAGNTGSATILIQGSGFYEGTSVKLTRPGYSDMIVADSQMNIVSGQQIYMYLDFDGVDTGYYNVIVSVPNDTVMTVSDGLKIEPGKTDVWVNVIGSNGSRGNVWQSYKIVYGNNGNVDALAVPLYIAIPNSADIKFDRNFLRITSDSTYLEVDTIYQVVSVDSLFGQPYAGKVYCMVLASISAQSRELPFQLKVVANSDIKVWMSAPMYGPTPKLSTNSTAKTTLSCRFDPQTSLCLIDAIDAGVGYVPGPIGCGLGLAATFITPLVKYGCVYPSLSKYEGKFGANGKLGIVTDLTYGLGNALFTCATQIPPGPVESELKGAMSVGIGSELTAVTSLDEGIDIGNALMDMFDVVNDCRKLLPQLSFNFPIRILQVKDPNEKNGPIGYGLQNSIQSNNEFGYAIEFENSDTATASVQTIKVTDTLDINQLDTASFELGNVRIGNTTIYFPSNTKRDIEYVDYRPMGKNIIVKIDAALNDTTGLVIWLFSTLDPETLQPITDPYAGFLPPNVNAPEGHGNVSFTIKTKTGLPTNSIIKNKASIYFDNNAPVITAPWTNTIDDSGPQSRVSGLPQYIQDTIATIQWNGSDTGIGVKDYTIYVSENGNPYQIWKYHTSDLTGNFNGKYDSSYAFYSVARDSVGNTEPAPSVYDAITTFIRPGTNINNNTSPFGVSVYPNPTLGIFSIQGTNVEDEDVSVTVTDIIGRVVLQSNFNNNRQKVFKKTLSLAGQTKGYYTATVHIGSWKQSFKLIKL